MNLIHEYRNYLWETDKDGKIINDPSPNIQLYTIGRLGITRMGFNREMTDSSNIAALIERGADKILRVGEDCADSSAEFFYTDTLFDQDGIYVFDLARHKKTGLSKDLEEAQQIQRGLK